MWREGRHGKANLATALHRQAYRATAHPAGPIAVKRLKYDKIIPPCYRRAIRPNKGMIHEQARIDGRGHVDRLDVGGR
jgi:hypothetical protein